MIEKTKNQFNFSFYKSFYKLDVLKQPLLYANVFPGYCSKVGPDISNWGLTTTPIIYWESGVFSQRGIGWVCIKY